MTISAKVIADSISIHGNRLTSVEYVAPRVILAEINTHRVFSRNAASSRAIPTKKLIEMVRTDPFIPVRWGKNQPGMQAREELPQKDQALAGVTWRRAAQKAADTAEELLEIGVHKEVVNRVLEPFLYVRGLITATEWNNFFAQRCHEDAQPEMQVLAEAIRDAREASTPRLLQPTEWHLPYITDEDYVIEGNGAELSSEAVEARVTSMSVARCARVSYRTHENTTPTVAEDLGLYRRLKTKGHYSPFEHVARPDFRHSDYGRVGEHDPWGSKHLHGNFKGWCQYRRTLEGENQANVPTTARPND